jgi:hypothetical protein
MRSKLKQAEKHTLGTTEKFDLTEQQMNWRKKGIKREGKENTKREGIKNFIPSYAYHSVP